MAIKRRVHHLRAASFIDFSQPQDSGTNLEPLSQVLDQNL